jgi:molybdopterin molybdotransferase
VLAEDVFADRDYPPFDKSQMDGFAVRCADASVGAELNVVGEVAAGQWPQVRVEKGQAAAVMTGAPIPAGADCVAPVEDVEDLRSQISDGRKIRISRATSIGRYIARRGSDVAAKAKVLSAGQRLTPAALAVAASVGAARVRAFARPRAAVLGTGNELVSVEETPANGQIRNSNNLMLVSLLSRMGCDVRDLGIIPDDPARIHGAIREGLDADVVFVTGGMSMGEYDYVPRILSELGIKLLITKLRIKPGKPFVFGRLGEGVVRSERKYVFGLPGNPVSGFVCAVRLASRLIARLSGGEVEERWVEGRLAEPLPPNGPREFYQPAIVRGGSVTVLCWKGSADLYTLARANALLVRGENEAARGVGEIAKLLEVPQ